MLRYGLVNTKLNSNASRVNLGTKLANFGNELAHLKLTIMKRKTHDCSDLHFPSSNLQVGKKPQSFQKL